MTEPTDALLPCPFCGEVPHLKRSIKGDYTSIVCPAACGGPLVIVIPNDRIEEGIAAWNRRTNSTMGQPAHAAEPVAYLTRNAEGDPAMLFFDKDEASTYCEDRVDPEPLFTPHQPTRAQAGAEPLSDEQIQDLLLCGDPTDEEMRLIRIGWDAAHGIKGGQHDL